MFNNFGFTKREIIVLTTLGVFMLAITLLFEFTSFEMTEGWEMLFFAFIGFPLGLLIATDPQRIKRKDK